MPWAPVNVNAEFCYVRIAENVIIIGASVKVRASTFGDFCYLGAWEGSVYNRDLAFGREETVPISVTRRSIVHCKFDLFGVWC